MEPLKVLEGGWRKIKEEEPGGARDMKYEMEGTVSWRGPGGERGSSQQETEGWRERKVPAGDRGYFELSQEDSVKGVTGP